MEHRILDLFIKALIWVAIASPFTLVRAQTTNATCAAAWNWASNSRQQSPCQVAAYLLAPCANGQWNVPALQSGQYYTPPTVSSANQCSCSTVVYQLMSACGSCQGQNIVAWSTWRGQCADGVASIASYPRSIPGATSVPAWAYINIVSTDVFNAAIAQAAANQPESSVSASTSGTSTSSTPASSSSTSASSSASASESASTVSDPGGSSSPNIAAIVGGTVGGVIGIGLIICLAIFLMKRQSHKSKMPPSAEFSKVIPPGSPVPASFDPAAVGFRSRTNSPMSNGLNSDYGHGPNMHQISMNGHSGTAPAGYGGSPWSPPPMGHTPAPSGGGFSSAYTPQPPGIGQPYTYTPPPGTMGGSQPSFQQQYAHSHSNSGGATGYNPTPVSHQNMNVNPYGGHASNSSYSGAPEL